MAQFNEPTGVAILPNGHLLVADQMNHVLREVKLPTGFAETLTLGNPIAAGPGRLAEVTLAAQTVAPGRAQIRVIFRSPIDHHLNSLAPSILELNISNPSVVEPDETMLRWSTDEAEVVNSVPANFGEGEGELTASGTVYYCRTGEEVLCFIQRLELRLPVRVVAGAASGELLIDYELPSSAG
ncbi:MAG TPA: hypothetical protein QGF35_07335 [Dehalococcoidia bacterium]|nr:hypothetical protein [Dehalococcoidia bacterium]